MYCTICGNLIPANTRFCNACGAEAHDQRSADASVGDGLWNGPGLRNTHWLLILPGIVIFLIGLRLVFYIITNIAGFFSSIF